MERDNVIVVTVQYAVPFGADARPSAGRQAPVRQVQARVPGPMSCKLCRPRTDLIDGSIRDILPFLLYLFQIYCAACLMM
jgi:hypothetical protein